MRGGDDRTGALLSYVDLEARVQADHPLRTIRRIVNAALATLEREFASLYSPIGRPWIPPEKLLRAMLLQAFDAVASVRDGSIVARCWCRSRPARRLSSSPSPAIEVGDNAKLLVGRALASLDMANRTIVDCHAWNEDVRASDGKGKRK